MKSVLKLNAPQSLLFLYILVVFLLALASVNINDYLTPKVVLGAKTEESNSDEYWRNFISDNPNYIPGLIELGEFGKAREVDPNYLKP